MFSTSQKQEPQRNIQFQTTNQEGEESIEIFDLNKIFQMNFSYNFDILKNLIEALMKNQQNIQNDLKEKETKILELETQILGNKISDNISGDKSARSSKNQPLSSRDSNKKLVSVIKGNQDVLRKPPNDIKLEVSIGNDDTINKIIVSIKIIIIFFRKKLMQ
jgi:hypothetical protein